MSITLAQLVKEARRRQCLTQGQVRKIAGTTLENIIAIEEGQNKQPGAEIIAGLSKALKLTAEDINAAIAGTLDGLPWEKVSFPTYWGAPRKTDSGFNQPFKV